LSSDIYSDTHAGSPEVDIYKENTIEKIIAKRTFMGQYIYFVKWRDIDDEFNTWEPQQNIPVETLSKFNSNSITLKLSISGGSVEHVSDEDYDYSGKINSPTDLMKNKQCSTPYTDYNNIIPESDYEPIVIPPKSEIKIPLYREIPDSIYSTPVIFTDSSDEDTSDEAYVRRIKESHKRVVRLLAAHRKSVYPRRKRI